MYTLNTFKFKQKIVSFRELKLEYIYIIWFSYTIIPFTYK